MFVSALKTEHLEGETCRLRGRSSTPRGFLIRKFHVIKRKTCVSSNAFLPNTGKSYHVVLPNKGMLRHVFLRNNVRWDVKKEVDLTEHHYLEDLLAVFTAGHMTRHLGSLIGLKLSRDTKFGLLIGPRPFSCLLMGRVKRVQGAWKLRYLYRDLVYRTEWQRNVPWRLHGAKGDTKIIIVTPFWSDEEFLSKLINELAEVSSFMKQ